LSFGFKIEQNSTQVTLSLVGEIDERANFKKIQIPAAEHLFVDLSGVRLLNSAGLRSWVLWARDLSFPVITMIKCPSVVVHQMNVLDGFMPFKAVIKSIELPYICEECHHEERRWIERGKDFMEQTAEAPAWHKAPEEIKCPKCGEKSVLDVLPLRYFSFLTNPK